jgi:hypothetical protein
LIVSIFYLRFLCLIGIIFFYSFSLIIPNLYSEENKLERTEGIKSLQDKGSKTETEKKATNPKEKEQDIQIDPKNGIKKIPIELGIFVDGYYNYNLNRPSATSQNYTTQAIQNDNFAINLAHIEGKLDSEKFRGRLALQYGTSVNANYTNETSNQKNSNQNSVRNIQEAYVGMKLGKKTWLDAGIYLGNIGFEAWASAYNWVYTRAIVLDNVPYYSTGVRLSHEFSDRFSIQLHIMNGWQNITDNNKDKSLGMQFLFKLNLKEKFTYNNFIGNETPSKASTDLTGMVYYSNRYTTRNTRYYHNFIYQQDVSDRLSFAGSMDVGFQIRGKSDIYNPVIPSDINSTYPYYNSHSNAFRQWYNATLWVTYKLFPEWRTSGRIEKYIDREETNVSIVKQSTNFEKHPGKKSNGFQVFGISLNLDYIPTEYTMLRFELKYRRSMDPIFDYSDSTDLSRIERLFISAMSLKY